MRALLDISVLLALLDEDHALAQAEILRILFPR